MIRPVLIFTFNFDIMLLEVHDREAIQSQCLPPTLYVNNIIATYISGVTIIHEYSIDDFYHTEGIDPPDMVNIVYIICAYYKYTAMIWLRSSCSHEE